MNLRILSALAAGVMTMAFVVPAAHALSKEEAKCQATIAKDGGKFMKAVLKEKAKCADKNLKSTGSCDFTKRGEKLAKAEAKLRKGLQKSCTDKLANPAFDAGLLAILGFPGKCVDNSGPGNGFTGLDLQDCIFETHTAQANALFALQYGSNGDDGVADFVSRDAVNGKAMGKCQKELGKNGLKHLLTIQKEITKCRNGLLKEPPKFTGFLAVDCGDNPILTKPKEKIDKSRVKLIDKITGKCDITVMASPEMDVCDTGSGPQTTPGDAANCIAAVHENATDDPENTGIALPLPTDLVDIEYALGASCGDNIVNEPAIPAVLSANFFLGAPPEECDGTDDSACPGACGSPSSSFPCVCTDTPRERIIEHDTTNLDNGWTGTSHDSVVVQGGGYMIDVYDCDGPGGPDTLCNVGPSCNNVPNQPCASDAACLGVGNFCRKTGIAVGPHCNDDIQRACSGVSECLKCTLGTNDGGYGCDPVTVGTDCPLSGTCGGGTNNGAACSFDADCPLAGVCSGPGNAGEPCSDQGPLPTDCPSSLPGTFCDGDFCVIPDDACSLEGDFCRKTAHGIPLPLSAGGTAVCVVNTFSEDVVGTTDYATGEGAVRLRQDAVTHIASGTLNSPCPTCGGFCAGTSNAGAGPGQRILCAADSDCPASVTCVTSAICSFGPNEDLACRRVPPFGNATVLFGSPSVDCPPNPGNDISSGGLDILFNPSTTGTVVAPPGMVCSAPGFQKKCIAGSEVGKSPCVNDADCAGGGVGSCLDQCFCPSLGGNPQKPSDCFSACNGGTNDYGTCGAASDCPGGLCEPSACRIAAGVCTGGTIGVPCTLDAECGAGGTCGDADSSGEGFCPGGPTIGLCSFTTLQGCLGDSECRPSGSCSFCKSDNSETCQFKNKDCFPSIGYSRTGVAGTPNRTTVANFCIPASGSSAINGTAGLPGPAAIEQPVTLENTF